jgi:hypothetical protein
LLHRRWNANNLRLRLWLWLLVLLVVVVVVVNPLLVAAIAYRFVALFVLLLHFSQMIRLYSANPDGGQVVSYDS